MTSCHSLGDKWFPQTSSARALLDWSNNLPSTLLLILPFNFPSTYPHSVPCLYILTCPHCMGIWAPFSPPEDNVGLVFFFFLIYASLANLTALNKYPVFSAFKKGIKTGTQETERSILIYSANLICFEDIMNDTMQLGSKKPFFRLSLETSVEMW